MSENSFLRTFLCLSLPLSLSLKPNVFLSLQIQCSEVTAFSLSLSFSPVCSWCLKDIGPTEKICRRENDGERKEAGEEDAGMEYNREEKRTSIRTELPRFESKIFRRCRFEADLLERSALKLIYSRQTFGEMGLET